MEKQQFAEKFYSFIGVESPSKERMIGFLQIFVIILLFMIAVATLIKTNWWNNYDLMLSQTIHDTLYCGLMDSVAILINDRVGPSIWYTLGAILLVPKKTRKLGIIILLAAVAASICFEGLVKTAVARVRPYHFINLDTIVTPPSGYSFPSGHSLAAFSAAGCIFWYNRKLGIAAIAVAIFIALSRVYVFAHFLTDVTTGAVLGLAISYIVYTVLNENWETFFTERNMKKDR